MNTCFDYTLHPEGAPRPDYVELERLWEEWHRAMKDWLAALDELQAAIKALEAA